jgi:hypothetical protein
MNAQETFDFIRRSFLTKLKEEQLESESYSFLASPLRRADILIVGLNPGGQRSDPSQNTMPEQHSLRIPEELSSPTFAGYYNFLIDLNNNDTSLANTMIDNVVITNACFLRTPRSNNAHRVLIEQGLGLTLSYLLTIIQFVRPRLIIAFGNGEVSPTGQLSSFKIARDDKEKWWKDKSISLYKYTFGYQSTIYRFPIESMTEDEDICVTKVIGLPHGSLYGRYRNALKETNLLSEIRRDLHLD